jgi:hypothetical protein
MLVVRLDAPAVPRAERGDHRVRDAVEREPVEERLVEPAVLLLGRPVPVRVRAVRGIRGVTDVAALLVKNGDETDVDCGGTLTSARARGADLHVEGATRRLSGRIHAIVDSLLS